MGVIAIRKKRNPEAVKIANDIIAAYKPESVEEIYLGYESNSKLEKLTENRRNGYSDKKLKTSTGETEISIPRDSAA